MCCFVEAQWITMTAQRHSFLPVWDWICAQWKVLKFAFLRNSNNSSNMTNLFGIVLAYGEHAKSSIDLFICMPDVCICQGLMALMNSCSIHAQHCWCLGLCFPPGIHWDLHSWNGSKNYRHGSLLLFPRGLEYFWWNYC